MRDVELYQQLLGVISPWTVNRVELSVEDERVDILAENAPEMRWPCSTPRRCHTQVSPIAKKVLAATRFSAILSGVRL